MALLTAYDQGYRSFADRALPGFKRFAETFGIDLRVITEIPDDRPATWQKIRFIRQLFDDGYDSVLWVDIDCLFVRFDESIHSVLRDGKDFYACYPGWDGGERLIEFEVQMNCGVMLWRNTEWSKSILDLVWQQEQFINQRWNEQAAIMHVLGYHSWLDPAKRDALNHAHLKKVQQLSTNWNCVSGFIVSDNPIIVHFAGAFRQQRMAALTRLAGRLPELWELPKYPRRKILFELGCQGAAEVFHLIGQARGDDVKRLEDDVKRLQADQLRLKADADRMLRDASNMRAEMRNILDSIDKGLQPELSTLGRLGELAAQADAAELAAKQTREGARKELEQCVLLLLGARRDLESVTVKAAELDALARRAGSSRALIVPLLALR